MNLEENPLDIIKIAVEPPRYNYVYTFNPHEQLNILIKPSGHELFSA